MDDVLIWCAVATHEEVLRLYITIDQVLAVYILNSGNLGSKGGREGERERNGGGRRERIKQRDIQIYD